MNTVLRQFGSYLARYLTRPRDNYEQFSVLNKEQLDQTLEPGDLLLVEGNSRVSTAIKYLTQSTWSHVCMYVFHQLPFATDRVDNLQQRGSDQSLRRDRRSAVFRVDLIENRIQIGQRFIHQFTHLANRVALGNTLLQRYIAEQIAAFLVITAHCLASNLRLRYFPSMERLFQQPAKLAQTLTCLLHANPGKR
jgi:hypothetical protein